MTRPDLMIEDVTVRFGGLVAVDGVTIHASAGSATGLIGPNGAGKTTTFNATTGVVHTAGGSVRLGERRLDGMAPTARARAGLGRTFQRMELFDTMTVAENVASGPEMRTAGRAPWAHLASSRREATAIAAAAEEAMTRCDLEAIATRPVGDLSTGQRRLVELARAIASDFDFLLLDEPSSGLDPAETDRFVAVLRELVDRSGIGLLVVEHDMALVRALCADIYVLDFGKLLTSGPADEVLASELVREAYLGSDAVEEAVA